MTPQLTNRLLQSLPPSDLARMLDSTETIDLPVRTLLYASDIQPRYAYFLTSGMASMVTNTVRGDVAEVGVIGREGVVGALHLLGPLPVPTQCFMQLAGSARRLLFSDLQSIYKDSVPMHANVLEFIQLITINACQLAACNALHTLEQRLARWLLVVQDRMEGQAYALTHEFLAEMLVVQRPTLSIVAASMQREGKIQYRHGQLSILNRERLEATACECYALSRNLLEHLYAGPERTDPPLYPLKIAG